MGRQKPSRRKRRARPARRQSSSTWLYLLLGGVGLVAVALVLVAVAGRPSAPTPAPTVASTSSEDIPHPEVPRIPLAEAKAKVDSGEAVFVDVRTAPEYADAHPAGAISLPLSELDARYQELPRDKEIITICA